MTRSEIGWTVAICTMALLATSRLALAERTLNRGIHAVPAPRAVTIDGDLSEWDTSGEIICCKDVDKLLDVESARLSAMWDEDNLYLCIKWRDDTPMQNKVDPVTMVGNGWRSDCVQLRSNMDGFVSHVDCWYYTTGKKPAITISYGHIGVKDGGQPKVDRPAYPEKLGAQQAFRLAPDGGGYVQEMKIPWAVLTLDGGRPRDGADLRLGVEFIWGDVSADNWPKGRITENLYEGETQTDFFWTNVKVWGRLILEKEGNLALPPPPWLKSKRAEPKGPVAVTFSVPKESYVTIALEDPRGNRVKSLVGGVKYAAGTHTIDWSGLDDRDGLLSPGRYRWAGIYRDAISTRWKMSYYQANREIPWPNAQGTGAWGPDHGNLNAAAASGGKVFLGGLGAEAGLPLMSCDQDGRKIWSAKSGEPDRLACVDGILYGYTSKGDSNWLGITPRGVMKFEADTGKWLDVPGADGKPTRRRSLLGKDEFAAGFAADEGGLYLSVEGKSVVRRFDPRTLELAEEYDVAGAGEIFSAGGRRLLVLTSDSLVALDPASGATRTLASGDFSRATAIAADDRGRNAYVAFGSPLHQVHEYRLGSRSARKVRELGRRGGRTRNGRYDPEEGFRNPSGLAVDTDGRLWVVENDQRPKRVSVWGRGRWVREFIGDTGYGGGGAINPLDPTEAFYRDMTFRIDLDAGEWKLTHVGFVMPEGGEKIGVKSGSGDHATGSDVDAECAMVHRGRTYIHKCRGARHTYRKLDDGRWGLCLYVDARNKVAWMDGNDDCKVQDDEIVRGGPGDDWGSTDYWGMRPSKNLDLFFTRGVQRPGLRLRLQRVTPGGTPIYDFTKFEHMAGECMNGIGLADGSYNSGCAGERGEYFSEMRRIHPGGVSKRTFWFRGLNTGRWTARLPEPGLVLYPFQAHGIADVGGVGEVVCWVSDFGQRYLFTDDMLYVEELFADSRVCRKGWPNAPEPGFVADEMSPGQESFHGFFTRLDDGRYIMTTGFTDCRVFEITGLGSIKRINGSVELKREHLARSRQIQQFRRSGGKSRGSVVVARSTGRIGVDGSLDGWKRENAVRIEVDADRSAEVLTAYDRSNLYVAWDVKDPNPMRNSAQDWRIAFKGGDAVDLMLRRPGGNLDDAVVRDGDMRLLITEIDGEAKAILYRQISSNRRPHVFDAFEGAGRANAVRMDEVRPATEVAVAIRRGQGGYVVEAKIPWRLLGVRATSGVELRMDFGVLYSDPGGGRTMLRVYWENRDTNIVSDIPSEAALSPGKWGVAKLGR